MVALLLGPVLRHVTDTSATIWVETDQPCTVEVLGHSTRTFAVESHHYALVIVEGLAPGSTTEYEVTLDEHRCWPLADSTFPPSVIRTLDGGPLHILFGSCRAAAPHEAPWNLELDHDDDGRGVDALYAHGLRMLDRPPAEWADLLLFVGDQVYADDSSPTTRAAVERRRGHRQDDETVPSLDDVADFEEYTWLYREAWSPPVERWMLSVLPSAMIFDDHDMIDDWNTSLAWIRSIRDQPWWHEHVIGGLMSYWVHQHLGNLSPADIRGEGMLERFVELGDASAALREWAEASEAFTPTPGGYRFSFVRDLGDVRIVVIDSRNARVLEGGPRQMVDDDEWAWVVEHSLVECDHLVLATSVPVVMPGGLHDLERWNELVCDGAWGRWMRPVGEAVRQAVDLEHWPAFHRSYDDMMTLLRDVATPDDRRHAPPSTVTIVSGDVHFSFVACAQLPDVPGREKPVSHVHQIVNSPIRNVLTTRERRVIRFGLGPVGVAIARVLRRSTRARPEPIRWQVDEGPFFANHICVLELDGDSARMVLERAHPDDDGRPLLSLAADTTLTSAAVPRRGGRFQRPTRLPRPPRPRHRWSASRRRAAA